jgi:hypothetical protein
MSDGQVQPKIDGRAGNGGARVGSGRKAKADKYAGPIAAAEDRIADRLPQLIDNLEKLADGGFLEVHEEWQPAGLVTTGSGEYEQRVFPELPADELVRVKRTVSRAAPDRAANIYLVDRILGKPTAAVEVTGEHGGPIEHVVLTDAERAGRVAQLLTRAGTRRAAELPDGGGASGAGSAADGGDAA